jgi:hypothetical protein
MLVLISFVKSQQLMVQVVQPQIVTQ